MEEYIYPYDKKVYVSYDAKAYTPGTFKDNGVYWEKESLDYFYNLVESIDVSGTKNFVDIGAQTGLYSLYTPHMKNTMLYAYEPNPEAYKYLVSNCILNKIDTSRLVNKAVGKKIEKLSLHIPLGPLDRGLCCLGKEIKRFSEWKDVEVDVITLDSEFFEKDIPVHIIKCDTEGWEVSVIEGGRKTIEKWHPDLFIEVNDCNLSQSGYTRGDIIGLVESFGYRLVDIKDGENFHYTCRVIR
jgi:FkbM family methyltransferase